MSLTKYIFIVRHGHSGFDAPNDKSRCLTNQGLEATALTSNFIKSKINDYHLTIDHVISSDAIRTCQTAEVICSQLKADSFEQDENLYSTVASQWIDKIIESSSMNLVLVGHNPTLSQLVNRLTGNQCYMSPADCAFVKLEIINDEIKFPAELLGYKSNE